MKGKVEKPSSTQWATIQRLNKKGNIKNGNFEDTIKADDVGKNAI